MAPSAIFWLDTLVSLATSLFALALLLLVLGVGARRRLNQTFGLFTLFAALVGLGSGVGNINLWLNSRVLTDSAPLGAPIAWIELASLGFYFVGPALFAFATTYVESKARWHHWLSIIGFLIGLALVPLAFGGQVIQDFYLGQADLPRWDLEPLGYAASIIPFFFEFHALFLFWRNRQRLGGSVLTVSTGILLAGSVIGGLVRIPFPTVSATFALALFVMGYVVTSHQIFNPLRTLTERLESEVAQRTRELQQARSKLQRLNEQQRIAAEISREVGQAATPTEMLDVLVDRIHNRLGYHHVYVYQPDATGSYLVLKSAAGTTSRTLLEKNHRIPQSENYLPSQAAVKKQPRLAEAKDDDAIYFGDTALPGARAEIALPLLAGNRLLGVLNLQSIHFEAFSAQDLSFLTPLADQVAITLDNARLLQEAEKALNEAERIQRQYVRQAWQTTLGPRADGSTESQAYAFSAEGQVRAIKLEDVWSPEIAQAVTTSQTQFPSSDQAADEIERSTVALPIILRGQVIGAMQLRHRADRSWQPDELEALRDIAERLALSLENARLFQETRARAGREQLAREITDKMRRATDMDELMQITIQEMANALGTPDTFIQLSTLKTATSNKDAVQRR